MFSALGFYPLNPASGEYVFGSPLINDAVINLPGAKKFHIRVVGNSAQNKYIQRISLNGKDHNKTSLSHSAIIKGAELVIYMGAKPLL
ncbi:Glycosyl hydrolase family 92 [compost metagenome]